MGKRQWLEAGGQAFLGSYTASNPGTSQDSAIMLPSLGDHPDWPDVSGTPPLKVSALAAISLGARPAQIPSPMLPIYRKIFIFPYGMYTGAAILPR